MNKYPLPTQDGREPFKFDRILTRSSPAFRNQLLKIKYFFGYNRDFEIITKADVNIANAANKQRNKIIVALDDSACNLYYGDCVW